MPKKSVAFELDIDVFNELKAFADNERRSVSSCCRQAIDIFLEGENIPTNSRPLSQESTDDPWKAEREFRLPKIERRSLPGYTAVETDRQD